MDNNDAESNRQADLAETFIRQLINRHPGGAEVKILGKVEEIYIAELREHYRLNYLYHGSAITCDSYYRVFAWFNIVRNPLFIK